MPLPERTIEAAIDRLKTSPGKFQRLIERYAHLAYPNKFNGLIPQGRSSNDVTVKGWPDMYSLSPTFMLNVVEVTHSPSWASHLEEDLEKAEALGTGRLSGFLFVAWATEPSPLTTHKKPNPKYERLLSYRKRLVALGISPEDIDFVFKKRLVRALSQPRFANIVTGILGLPSHCAPFKTISTNREIFGTSGNYDVFAPSKEEFENDLVHRTGITDEVETRLKSIGWAWLRGRGAAGKTVLAIHVGRTYEARSFPAYYLDLSKTDVTASEALNVITTHADDGVLFIIDNVHLNQAFARDCFDHWQSFAAGSHLLMIGRDTTTTDYRGTALPLDDLRAEAQTLEVTPEDLKGVFLRLARRMSSSDSVPSPPPDALQDWHKLFGGDLVAFSAAVAHRSKQMGGYDWTIQARDATRYVQQAYLGKASEAERLNLLRLAVLARLELDLPEEALELATIEQFLQNGLVHSVGRGRNNKYAYYRLVHPGLGDLLLTAAGYSDEELKQFISEQYGYIAYRNPLSAAYVAARLESSGRAQEGRLILKGVAELENGIVQMLVASGSQSFRVNTERLTRLGALSVSEIEDKLSAVSLTLDESFLRGSLGSLRSFLEYIEWKLPRLYSSLMAEIEQPERSRELTRLMLRTPVHFLPTMFEYAERKLPNLYSSFVAELEQPEKSRSLREKVLQIPQGELVYFLQYAERKLPNLYSSFVAVLEQPGSARELAQLILRTPLQFLPTFLEYAASKLPKLYSSLVELLEQPGSVKVLGESALRTSLDNLTTFLQYAERKLPKVYKSCVDVFEQPESARELAPIILWTPLHFLPMFFEYAERKLPKLYRSLVTELEQPENTRILGERVLNPPLGDLSFFLQYTERQLPRLHRPLVAVLQQPESAGKLAQLVLRTPLHFLPAFLQYAERQLPRLYRSLLAVLEEPETAATLGQATLQIPLSDLAFFLEYADGKLPRLYTSLVAMLQQPESIETLSERALETPLGELASFLEYVDENLPGIGEPVTNKLTDPTNFNVIVETLYRTQLDGVVHFLQTVRFGSTIVHAIDKTKWDKTRQENVSEQLHSFTAAARTFQSLGRPELGETSAVAFMRVADQEQWNLNSIGLRHLSYVMWLGRSAGEDVIRNFITNIITPSWLEEKYDNSPTYGIANALFSLWGYYDDAVLSHFNTGTLRSRVRSELNYLSRLKPEELSSALQLLGVSALLGTRVGMINITWPDVDRINGAIRLTAPSAEATSISYVAIQVWLGLRVMAGIRPDPIYIQPELGDPVLAMWKSSTGYTGKQNALNRSMIPWIESCARSGWLLVPDRQKDTRT